MEIPILKNAEKRETRGIEYFHFREERHGITRGTVVLNKRVVPGYPHIKRIFTLEKGLERNIDSEFVYLEEKIDGYNVRIISWEGKIYAFSRGGYLDLFVTEKVREIEGIRNFFNGNEEYILCGEMIGNTPHTTPTKKFDTRLFVFDIMDKDCLYVKTQERYAILDKYKINGVHRLGRFKKNDYKNLKKIFLKLDRQGAEGMVIRGEKQTVKYVTPSSDIRDIEESSAKFFDMPIGFFYQRILRTAFTGGDFDLKNQEEKLGKAFYKPLILAVKNAKKGKRVVEEFEILIRDKGIWEEIEHSSKEIKITEISRKEEREGTRIKFSKEYKKTSKILMAYANGKAIED